MTSQDQLRALPAVEKALQTLTPDDTRPLPRPLVTGIVRAEIESLRSKIVTGDAADPGDPMAAIRSAIDTVRASRIRPVLNGTGVIIHTNLGRAPLGTATFDTLRDTATGYNNLELDLPSGERGKRGLYLERLLALLAEAPSATVVNNCASALILILRHFTAGTAKEIVISRGELVEIGGGFRVPEILEASGAILKEVGATNKTHLADYENAVSKNTALFLKVHRSNFYMGGFVDSPETEDLVALGQKVGIPVVEDLGSGAVLDTHALAPSVDHEPTPSEILSKGVDLVCVSGDKLFGGPQAGIIAGNPDLVTALKKNPFFRALRCDRLVLTALQETAAAYLSGTAHENIPVVQSLSASLDSLRERAETIIENLARPDVDPKFEIAAGTGESRLGGGTMPTSAIPSITLDLKPTHTSAKALARSLRLGEPAVVPYVTEDAVKIDLRTILPHQDESLTRALQASR